MVLESRDSQNSTFRQGRSKSVEVRTQDESQKQIQKEEIVTIEKKFRVAPAPKKKRGRLFKMIEKRKARE